MLKRRRTALQEASVGHAAHAPRNAAAPQETHGDSVTAFLASVSAPAPAAPQAVEVGRMQQQTSSFFDDIPDEELLSTTSSDLQDAFAVLIKEFPLVGVRKKRRTAFAEEESLLVRLSPVQFLPVSHLYEYFGTRTGVDRQLQVLAMTASSPRPSASAAPSSSHASSSLVVSTSADVEASAAGKVQDLPPLSVFQIPASKERFLASRGDLVRLAEKEAGEALAAARAMKQGTSGSGGGASAPAPAAAAALVRADHGCSAAADLIGSSEADWQRAENAGGGGGGAVAGGGGSSLTSAAAPAVTARSISTVSAPKIAASISRFIACKVISRALLQGDLTRPWLGEEELQSWFQDCRMQYLIKPRAAAVAAAAAAKTGAAAAASLFSSSSSSLSSRCASPRPGGSGAASGYESCGSEEEAVTRNKQAVMTAAVPAGVQAVHVGQGGQEEKEGSRSGKQEPAVRYLGEKRAGGQTESLSDAVATGSSSSTRSAPAAAADTSSSKMSISSSSSSSALFGAAAAIPGVALPSFADCLRVLLQEGWLVRRDREQVIIGVQDAPSYWLSIPRSSQLWSFLEDGRKELVDKIGRKK